MSLPGHVCNIYCRPTAEVEVHCDLVGSGSRNAITREPTPDFDEQGKLTRELIVEQFAQCRLLVLDISPAPEAPPLDPGEPDDWRDQRRWLVWSTRVPI